MKTPRFHYLFNLFLEQHPFQCRVPVCLFSNVIYQKHDNVCHHCTLARKLIYTSMLKVKLKTLCNLIWDTKYWLIKDSGTAQGHRLGFKFQGFFVISTLATMGVISTGDRGDMSPPLFKIPFVSPPLFKCVYYLFFYASGHRQGGASVCVWHEHILWERDRKRERGGCC